MSALKPRLLVFNPCSFLALWTCGQDDELVIHKQGRGSAAGASRRANNGRFGRFGPFFADAARRRLL